MTLDGGYQPRDSEDVMQTSDIATTTRPPVYSSTTPPVVERQNLCAGDNESAWRRFRERLLERIETSDWSSSKPPEMVAGVVDMAHHTLSASSCTLYLSSGHGHRVFYDKRNGHKPGLPTQARTDTLDGAAAWVMQHNSPIVLNETNEWAPLQAKQTEPLEKRGGRVLCVPLMADDDVLGALKVTRRKSEEPFTERDLQTAQVIGATAGIALENMRLRQSIQEGYHSTIRALASAVDAKDPYTCGHSQSVAQYSMVCGMVLGLDAEQMRTLETAALLHDIGKIGIDDAILRKPRKLSPTEQAIVRDHPVIGAAIVHDIGALQEVVGLILHHHEKYDGSGYPHGIGGEEIPLGSRIIGVGDAFDSMTTDRPYRRALTINEAMTELLRCRGTQFCPQALDAFAVGFTRHYDELPRRPRVLDRTGNVPLPIR